MNGRESVYVDGIDRPRFPVFDDEGNLYVGSYNGNIYKITPSKEKIVVAESIWSPQGMGFDLKGNLYVAGGYDGNIYKIKNGKKEVVASGFNFPKYLAVDADGDLYVVENGGNKIIKLLSGKRELFASFQEQINGMTTDENGNLYISHSDSISKITTSSKVLNVISELNRPASLVVYKSKLFVTTRNGIMEADISSLPKANSIYASTLDYGNYTIQG